MTMKEKQENKERGISAGVLTLFGAGLYDLEGIFLDEDLKGKREVYLHSMRFGEVIDGSESEMIGIFYLDAASHAGACKYSIQEVDVEEGVMELTIKTKDKKIIARFTGPSEGFGEVFVENKKGHLFVHPSEHENKVNLLGDSTISRITFELDNHIVTEGQPFDGIDVQLVNDNENQLCIDVKAGRHGSDACASFYTSFVNGESKHMMHTRGGSNVPSKLNFAFTGTLYIDEYKFEVCLGQGKRNSYNNWHLASTNLTGSSNNKSGNLGPFHITTADSENFKITRK